MWVHAPNGGILFFESPASRSYRAILILPPDGSASEQDLIVNPSLETILNFLRNNRFTDGRIYRLTRHLEDLQKEFEWFSRFGKALCRV